MELEDPLKHLVILRMEEDLLLVATAVQMLVVLFPQEVVVAFMEQVLLVEVFTVVVMVLGDVEVVEHAVLLELFIPVLVVNGLQLVQGHHNGRNTLYSN